MKRYTTTLIGKGVMENDDRPLLHVSFYYSDGKAHSSLGNYITTTRTPRTYRDILSLQDELAAALLETNDLYGTVAVLWYQPIDASTPCPHILSNY